MVVKIYKFQINLLLRNRINISLSLSGMHLFWIYEVNYALTNINNL